MIRIAGWSIIGILCIFVFTSHSIIFLDVERIRYIGEEDGIIENIGAISYCLASFLFFSLYLRSTGSGNEIGSFRTRKNIFTWGSAFCFLSPLVRKLAGAKPFSDGKPRRHFGKLTLREKLIYIIFQYLKKL